MRALRIVVIEDRHDVQDDLRTIIGTAPDMRLTRIFGSAEEARGNEGECDVMLLDVNLPGASGIDFLRDQRAQWPRMQFLMYSVHDDDGRVFEALKVGANGYLLKRSSPEQLLAGIRELHEGGSPMSASIARRLVEHTPPRAPG